jgi:SRSO17 transposase
MKNLASYLPKAWTDDRPRCQEARIPDEVTFATNPELARQMLKRAFDDNIPASWVDADYLASSRGSFLEKAR